MRYTISAYLCTNNPIKIDSLKTDFWFEVEDFIWDNVQKGFNCELIDNETGSRNWAYADDFDEESLNPEDLLREELK